MIDLTSLRCQVANVRMLDWSAMLTPTLGGVTQKISRLGTRFAIEFNVPPMRIEAEGRRAIALLQQAKQQGGRVAFPQVDFDVGTPGTPMTRATHAGGTTIQLKNCRPNYAVRQGQYLNVIRNDRSYLYCVAEQVIAAANGQVDITLTTMLRTQLAVNTVIVLGQPVIEGWIEGDELAWTLEMTRTVGLTFSIVERA